MAVYFTSDTHFSHANIIRLCNRPFADVDEMDEAIIERWNATVTSADTVYHLGDVALGQLSQSLPKVGPSPRSQDLGSRQSRSPVPGAERSESPR
ncbi:MAG: hypothetical protein WKF82_06805 [Nocardioidaceae bacterium]